MPPSEAADRQTVQMQSFASRLMPFVIRLRGSKRRYSSAERTLARVEELRLRPKSFEPPHSLSRIVDVRRREVGGWPVYELSPLRSDAPSRRALYLHGGSFVYEISSQHWQLAAYLAIETDARVIVPIYPLAPAGTALGTVTGCADLAEALIAEVGADNVTVLGDSAGGCMALATGLLLRDRAEGPAPASAPRLILISPVLDLSLTDPRVAELAVDDPWLAIPGSRVTGELYRGDLPIDHPLVSPIHGELSGLGPIAQYSGTRDMLNADAQRLVALARTAGHPLEYHEVAGMIHVYPLLPIPEATAAKRSMVEFMTRPLPVRE